MSKSRVRIVPFPFILGIWLAIIVPVILVAGYQIHQIRETATQKGFKDLRKSALHYRDLARQRYDLIQLYRFQEEMCFQERLRQMTELIVAVSRQAELESVRKKVRRDVAKELVLQTIANLKFGGLGYGFVLTGSGVVKTHPYLPDGLNISSYPYVAEMLEQKEGSTRYWWKHPGESQEMERLVTFQTIHAWDWVLCIAVPISELKDGAFEVQQWDGFFDYVKSARLNIRSDAMIVSREGRIVAHPECSPEFDGDEPAGIKEILNTRTRTCTFRDELDRIWYAGVTEFVPKRWVIAVAARESEILKEVYIQSSIILSIAGTVILCGCLLVLMILKKLGLKIHSQARRNVS